MGLDERIVKLIWLSLALGGATGLLLSGCDEATLGSSQLALGGSGQALPETPAILHDVAPIQGDQYTAPLIPAMRTSADGRVALNMKRIRNKIALFAFAPERLDVPLADSAAGAEILASPTAFGGGLNASLFHASQAAGSLTHMTLCDGTQDEPAPGETTNPYACGAGMEASGDELPHHDCYDLTVISVWDPQTSGAGGVIELWGTPITVEIAHPKTADAQIVDIRVDPPVLGPTWPINSLFEPMITREGRLLTGRTGNSVITWTHPDDGPMTHEYDIVYSVAPLSAAPCDVTAFTELLPMSHAPYDDDMKGRYGLAEYPFRDPEGALIPDGADLQVNYPWVDRDGDNLFMTTVQSTLFYQDAATGAVMTRYPASCVPGMACQDPATGDDIYAYEPSSDTRGIAVAGLWTHGKMVMLDTSINNTDYGLKNGDEYHRMLDLYSAAAGPTQTSVRVGSGRDNSTANTPLGAVDNTTFIDSVENLFNHDPNLRPTTPRDVVWTMNTGRGSAEIAFDDYLSPHALILSSMTGALSHSGAYDQDEMMYHDGFQRSGPSIGHGFVLDVRLQNAATSVTWTPPAHGVATGDVRLEPVALGGVEGKGLWLDGAAGVTYQIDAQPQDVTETPWYAGVQLGLKGICRFAVASL